MLEIEGLSAGYGELKVLSDVTLRVNADEIVTVIGANGAGKSTLLRALSGLIPTRGGRVTFSGKDITRTLAQDRVRLGLVHVPEGRQILAKLSVLENLMLGAFVHRANHTHVEQTRAHVFQMFPILQERKQQRAGSLSGGEQQMLAIGRALMSRPSLLMLDEPSLGLAPIVVKQIFEVIAQLRQEGIPVLLVEQNAPKALAIADRGVVLRQGQVAVELQGADLTNSEVLRTAYLGGA
jgi:branched-chain amino acid transport system ATP-binding protein